MQQDDEIVVEFLTESREMVEDSVPRLIELQNETESSGELNDETINCIFRAFHSIKGSAGFLDFKNIAAVTHAAETLLHLYRKGKKEIDPDGIDVLLKSCDFMLEGLNIIDESGTDESLAGQASALTGLLSAAAEEEAEVKKESESVETGGNGQEATKDDPEEVIDFSSIINDDMRGQFVSEGEELLGAVEDLLLSKDELDNPVPEVIPEAFRHIHSFKGNCGFMKLEDLQKVSHNLETILDDIREEKVDYSREAQDLFLDVIDLLKRGVDLVSRGEKGELEETEAYCSRLAAFSVQDEKSSSNPIEIESPSPASEEVTFEEKLPESKHAEAKVSLESNTIKSVPCEQKAETKEAKTKLPAKGSSGKQPSRPGKKSSGASNESKATQQSIRVDLAKLDNLNNLVGELVIAQAMVTNNPEITSFEIESFERASSHLDRIVRDLQDTAMSVRMIPIAGTFRKMVRLVHDLAKKVGKKINLTIKGEDTEIDKTVAELIADPLVHIIRNSVDHGLETEEQRISANKNEQGEIFLEARHEGGEIWVTIRDDGRGLNRDVILEKAIEKGLVAEDGEALSDDQVNQLIFEPGFSTAATISDVSGRGVGMDVVRKNIERLKGSIVVKSKLGQGTTVTLRIPLTLAIIEGMLVRVGKAKYTIPILAVRECLCSENGKITSPMDGDAVIRVRDDLVPIVHLSELHRIKADAKTLEDGVFVIIRYKNKSVAVFVDEVLGQHQTVIKGLPKYLGDARSVSGCTIMGDGDVSLILDPGGVLGLVQNSCV